MKILSNITVLLLITFILSGCSSTETTRSEETSTSMNTVEEHLNQLSEQVNETENALDNVSNATNDSEIQEAYNTFSDDVSRTIEMKEQLNNLVEEMRSTSRQYISEWQSQAESYDNDQLRRGSEERRQELSQAFNSVMDNSGDVSRTLETYISDIEEIESYLSNDLTVDAVQAVYSLTENVDQSGESVRQAINRMQSSLSEAQEKMGGRTERDD